MKSPLEKGLDFTFGVAILAAETLDKALTDLTEKGKKAQEHAPALFEALVEKGRPAREKLMHGIQTEMFHPMKEMGVPTASELQTLEERVADLEQQVSASSETPTTNAQEPSEQTTAEEATLGPPDEKNEVAVPGTEDHEVPGPDSPAEALSEAPAVPDRDT